MTQKNAKRLSTVAMLVATVSILAFASGCNREDDIRPIPLPAPQNTNYLVFDYQDTLEIAYALRTTQEPFNHIVLQCANGSQLDLYSYQFFRNTSTEERAILIPYGIFADQAQEGVSVVYTSEEYPDGLEISRGQFTYGFKDDAVIISILGATENGLGFHSHFEGAIHRLSPADYRGSLNLNTQQAFNFNLGMLIKTDNCYTYRIYGTDPNSGCTIVSYTDIRNKVLPISQDIDQVRDGNAVSFSFTLPSGEKAIGQEGTIQYAIAPDGVYNLKITSSTTLGETSALFVGDFLSE